MCIYMHIYTITIIICVSFMQPDGNIFRSTLEKGLLGGKVVLLVTAHLSLAGNLQE